MKMARVAKRQASAHISVGTSHPCTETKKGKKHQKDKTKKFMNQKSYISLPVLNSSQNQVFCSVFSLFGEKNQVVEKKYPLKSNC